MKKALVIYIVFFILTIAVPAIVCFAMKSTGDNSELVSIFRQCINPVEYYLQAF